LFESCENGEVKLAISEWAINEGLAAIDRKHRRGEMTIEERDKIIPEVLRKTRSLALTTNFILVQVESAAVSSSARLITERHLSADDSLQLFSALAAEAQFFVSADSRLNDAASAEGIKSFDIEKPEDAEELPPARRLPTKLLIRAKSSSARPLPMAQRANEMAWRRRDETLMQGERGSFKYEPVGIQVGLG